MEEVAWELGLDDLVELAGGNGKTWGVLVWQFEGGVGEGQRGSHVFSVILSTLTPSLNLQTPLSKAKAFQLNGLSLLRSQGNSHLLHLDPPQVVH